MKRAQVPVELIFLGRREMSYALYLCDRCSRLEMFHAEDGRWIRRTYYDDTPVLHKALRG